MHKRTKKKEHFCNFIGVHSSSIFFQNSNFLNTPFTFIWFCCNLLMKPATLLKLTLLHWRFSRFLNCTSVTKSRNASQQKDTRNISLCKRKPVNKYASLYRIVYF